MTGGELVSKYFLTMARPQQFDNEALLESMRETFLDLGPGASTQELAKRAGVSEGTLYKRFVSKRRMFTEALRLPEVEDFDWFTGIEARIGVLPVAEHLVSIATGMHGYASRLLPCSQMIGANGKLKPQDFAQLLGDDEEAPPFVVMQAITSLFEREVALGRMRPCDPYGLARLFLGALIHDVHLRMHFPDLMPEGVDAFVRRIVATIVDLTATVETSEFPAVRQPSKRSARSR